MGFNIVTWNKYYKKVSKIGEIIKKNIHDFHDTGSCDLSKIQIEILLKEADDICKESRFYMDKNGMTAPKPKWHYDPKDTTTWVSSPNFAYRHLLK